MQKKYQVFISSTYTDLKKERAKVQEILLMADCIPAGMEAFVASNAQQFEVIKKVIDLCDYYVLIIGGRYGTINKETDLSYTEMEYNYAVSKGIPILVFAIDDNVKLAKANKESNAKLIEKLKEFKKKAMTNRLASVWKDLGDLSGQVAISIMKIREEDKRPGWIRGDEYNPTELLQKITTLQDENRILNEENVVLKTSIDELTKQESDLEFEEYSLNVSYSTRSGVQMHKKITLKEIFKYVSIHLINVSKLESAIIDLIAESVGASSGVYLSDKTIGKRICNQFIELKLMYTKWSNENKGLYYGLTKKGEKLRNEMNLFKKESK